MKTHLARFSTAFVLLFAADGVLSVVDELLSRIGVTVLDGARGLLALVVVLLAGLMLLGLVIVPTLPKRTLLPLIVFTGWVMALAMPLPLWLGLEGSWLTLSVLQVGLAAAVLIRVPRGDDRSWIVPVRVDEGPLFSIRHSLVAGAVLVVAGPILFGSYAYLSAQAALAQATGGYVHLDLAGVELEERILVRTDTTIRLVGMMHIGDAEAYSDLYATFPADGCLILTEGVTDEQDLLPDFSYDAIAEALGLKSQSEVGMSAGPRESEVVVDPRIRHADVDVSSFSEETLDVLRELAHIFSAPDMSAMWKRYVGAVDGFDDAMIQGVMADLLDGRNRHLLAAIEAATADTDLVIVPWGALHLAWIEEQLLEDGFEVRGTSRRDHIRWRSGSDD